jgi:TRAP-type C4-dicarboxylate transport system substrate-binding protein
MKGEIMRKTLCLLVVGVLIGFFIQSMPGAPPAFAAKQDVIEWNVSLWGPLGARVWPIQWWAEEMEKRTNGRFKVILHPGAELAPPKEELDGIRAGLYDMAHFAALYHPGKTPLAMIFSNPCITPLALKDIAKLELAFMEFPPAKKLMAERWNAVYVGLSHTRPNYTFLGRKPVRSLEDLKGQRIRVGGKTGELFREFGAVPTMMPAPEIYEALSKGILDQSYLAPASHYGYNIHEVSDYFTYKIGAGSGMLWALVANKDSWEALPEDIKEIHKKLAKELMLERLPREMENFINGTIFPAWKKKGIEFIEFSAEDRAKLIEKAKPMWNEWAAELEKQGLPGKETLSYILEKKKEIEQ